MFKGLWLTVLQRQGRRRKEGQGDAVLVLFVRDVAVIDFGLVGRRWKSGRT